MHGFSLAEARGIIEAVAALETASRPFPPKPNTQYINITTNEKTKKTAPKTDNKPTLVAFLLDRTGSMDCCKAETIKGFNSYISELRAKDDGSMRFTLTQFDSQSVDIVHDAVPLKDVKLLTEETFLPRAFTPLYDAIGKTIRRTETQATGKFKVLFVTLTDGEENASTEWRSVSVKDLVKEKEDKAAWTFAYIGVGINGWASTHALASGTTGASNVLRTTHGKTVHAYNQLAGATVAYACSTGNVACSASDFWSDPDPEPPKAKK